MIEKEKIRVRFAPSPTGHLHIGGLRSALFNWLYARHYGGDFVVRIEDTDVVRSTKDYERSIIDSLSWVGIVSDEPIVYQLDRAVEHRVAAHRLLEQGLAYPCFCEPRDADDVIFDLEQGKGSTYSGACRDKAWTADDMRRPHAIRFRVPKHIESVYFDDMVLGRVQVQAEQLDDMVIIRRDGTPTYNFCVVVDDIFMNISHVIRGQDHVSNTAKQVLFYQALGAEAPRFAHIPLILGAHGAKLSKRDASVAVQEYKEQGYVPAALINYLVRLGWAHGDQEVFTYEQMVELFTLEAVGKKGAVFDIKKLQWLNGLYIRQMSVHDLLQAVRVMDVLCYEELHASWTDEQLHALVGLYQQRAVTLRELAHDICALARDNYERDILLIEKWNHEKRANVFNDVRKALEHVLVWNAAELQQLAQKICAEHDVKLVILAQALRLAVTGGIASPGIFEIMEIIGKERVLMRLSLLTW